MIRALALLISRSRTRFALENSEPFIGLAVERQDIAEPPGMGPLADIAKRGLVDRPARLQPPVVGHDDKIAVDPDRFVFLNDQWPVEPARLLFPAAVMRMIPKAAGIRRHKLIDKALSRIDRRLRQPRHPIHRIVDANAMPMHRRRLLQAGW